MFKVNIKYVPDSVFLSVMKLWFNDQRCLEGNSSGLGPNKAVGVEKQLHGNKMWFILSDSSELTIVISTEREQETLFFLIGSLKISQSVNIKEKSKPFDAERN